MPVTLWYSGDPLSNFPAGYQAVFNTVDEAVAQAVADIASGHAAMPDRVVTEDGTHMIADLLKESSD